MRVLYSRVYYWPGTEGDLVGMAMGWGRVEGWGFRPRPAWFCLASSPPRMTGKTFLLHPCPLGPREAPPHRVKFYFLLIFPTTGIIFY